VVEGVANEETMVEEVVTGAAAAVGREGAEDVAGAVHELRDAMLEVNGALATTDHSHLYRDLPSCHTAGCLRTIRTVTWTARGLKK